MKKNNMDIVLKISNSIDTLEKLYNKLAQAEIDGKLGTQEYDELIEYLKMVVEVHDKYVGQLDSQIDAQELFEISELIMDLNRFTKDDDIFFDILNLSEKNKIRRLYMDFYYLGLSDSKYIQFDDIYNDPELLTDEEIDNGIVEQMLIHELENSQEELLFEKLMSHTFMDYLMEYINDPKYSDIKSELIRVKYRIIFIYKHLENALIKNSKVFTYTPVYEELLKVSLPDDEEGFEEAYLLPLKSILEGTLTELLDVNGNSLKGKKNKTKAILKSLLVKTAYTINYSSMTNEEILELKNDTMSIIDSKKTQEMVEDAFNVPESRVLAKNIDL